MAGDGGGSGAVAGDDTVASRDDTTRGEGTDHEPGTGTDHDDGADWRGWLLVAVVVVSFVVVPAVVALRPPQLPFEVAFVALPMLPAVLLGATAVWAAVRGRERR